jgi:hypothetical protein
MRTRVQHTEKLGLLHRVSVFLNVHGIFLNDFGSSVNGYNGKRLTLLKLEFQKHYSSSNIDCYNTHSSVKVRTLLDKNETFYCAACDDTSLCSSQCLMMCFKTPRQVAMQHTLKYSRVWYNERMLQLTDFINKIRMLQRTQMLQRIRRDTLDRRSTRVHMTCWAFPH